MIPSSWGSQSASEGLAFLRGLSGFNIIAVDVNTVSPPHDVQNMTAPRAAQVIYESLVLLCQKPSGDTALTALTSFGERRLDAARDPEQVTVRPVLANDHESNGRTRRLYRHGNRAAIEEIDHRGVAQQ